MWCRTGDRRRRYCRCPCGSRGEDECHAVAALRLRIRGRAHTLRAHNVVDGDQNRIAGFRFGIAWGERIPCCARQRRSRNHGLRRRALDVWGIVLREHDEAELQRGRKGEGGGNRASGRRIARVGDRHGNLVVEITPLK